MSKKRQRQASSHNAKTPDTPKPRLSGGVPAASVTATHSDETSAIGSHDITDKTHKTITSDQPSIDTFTSADGTSSPKPPDVIGGDSSPGSSTHEEPARKQTAQGATASARLNDRPFSRQFFTAAPEQDSGNVVNATPPSPPPDLYPAQHSRPGRIDAGAKANIVTAIVAVGTAIAALMVFYASIESRIARLETRIDSYAKSNDERTTTNEKNIQTQFTNLEKIVYQKFTEIDRRLERLENKVGTGEQRTENGCDYEYPANTCPRNLSAPAGTGKDGGLFLCGMKGAAQNRAVIVASNTNGDPFSSDYLYQVRKSTSEKGFCGSQDEPARFKSYIPKKTPDSHDKDVHFEIEPDTFADQNEMYFCVTARRGAVSKVSGRIFVKRSCR